MYSILVKDVCNFCSKKLAALCGFGGLNLPQLLLNRAFTKNRKGPFINAHGKYEAIQPASSSRTRHETIFCFRHFDRAQTRRVERNARITREQIKPDGRDKNTVFRCSLEKRYSQR